MYNVYCVGFMKTKRTVCTVKDKNCVLCWDREVESEKISTGEIGTVENSTEEAEKHWLSIILVLEIQNGLPKRLQR